MSVRTLRPLLWPTAHAVSWLPVTLSAALGLAIVAVPEALTARLTSAQVTDLLRIAAVCVALGTAFLLDDPAARSTPTTPVSRLTRNLVRVAVAAPAVALWWAIVLWLHQVVAHRPAHHPAAPRIPGAALTLEVAALVTAALALAATAQRAGSDANAGVIAAPAVLALAAVAWFLPRRAALVLAPGDPHWAASHHRWAAVLGAALVAFLWASRERAARRGRRRRATVTVRPAPQSSDL